MKYASLQQLFLHKKILPLQTVQSCYRKLCIVVTEIGALLLPKSEHSRLPKSVHLSLPFTPSVLYVGDSGVDMQTAANAGLEAVAVTWGCRTREELASYSPAYIVDRPSQIADILF